MRVDTCMSHDQRSLFLGRHPMGSNKKGRSHERPFVLVYWELSTGKPYWRLALQRFAQLVTHARQHCANYTRITGNGVTRQQVVVTTHEVTN